MSSEFNIGRNVKSQPIASDTIEGTCVWGVCALYGTCVARAKPFIRECTLRVHNYTQDLLYTLLLPLIINCKSGGQSEAEPKQIC